MKKTIIKSALFNALATTLYILVIASSLFYAPTIFGQSNDKTVLIPIAMLSLLVFSVALTGSLIFGRPILWYMDGPKERGYIFTHLHFKIFLDYYHRCAFSFISYKIEI